MLNKESFIKKYNSFIYLNKGRKVQNPYEWYKICVESKPYFKRKFGNNLKKSFIINTQEDVKHNKDEIPIQPIRRYSSCPVKRLREISKDFLLKETHLKLEDFEKPRTKDGKKVCKIVQKCVDKARKAKQEATVGRYYFTYNNYPKEAQIYDGLYSLAEDLNRYHQYISPTLSFKSDSYECIISADPIDFLKLGHNYCDKGNSCFAQNGQYEAAKYKLAAGHNGFVFMVKDKDDIVGRFWGIYNSKNRNWHLSNMYTKHMEKKHIMYLFQMSVAEISKQETKFRKKPITTGRGVYKNGDNYVLVAKSRSNLKSIDHKVKYPKTIQLKAKSRYGTGSMTNFIKI